MRTVAYSLSLTGAVTYWNIYYILLNCKCWKNFKEEIIVRQYRQDENVTVNKLNSETVLQRIKHVVRDVKVENKIIIVGRQAEFSPIKN